jgi:hypothetical protein
MGYALCTSACANCYRIFSYNPVRVPSVRVNGRREPVCLDCITRANPKRIAKGLDPLVVHPDAYIACDEGELS